MSHNIKEPVKTIVGKTLRQRAVHVLCYLREYKRHYKTKKTLRLVAYYFWYILMNRLYNTTNEHTVRINGYKLRTIAKDLGISQELLIFRTHEPLSTRLLYEEIKEGIVCIDIGSNIGYYAILESKLIGDGGQVIAFEPLQKNYETLLHNIDLNKLSNVKAYNTAVG